jgi:hypothetical protein
VKRRNSDDHKYFEGDQGPTENKMELQEEIIINSSKETLVIKP